MAQINKMATEAESSGTKPEGMSDKAWLEFNRKMAEFNLKYGASLQAEKEKQGA